MKVCTCFLLFTIFGKTIASILPTSPAESNQHLNEASNRNEKLLNIVQNFITNIKTVINSRETKHDPKRSKTTTLSDFIEKAIKIVNHYDNSAFKDFFNVLDDEIRNYNYKNSKFHELTENDSMKNLLTSKFLLDNSKQVPISKSKLKALGDLLKDEKYDADVKAFVDYVNSLYKQIESTFDKVLHDLESYGKSKSKNTDDLTKIVRNGVRSIIFDHYSGLESNDRHTLKYKIVTLWKRTKKSTKSKTRSSIKFYKNESTTKTVVQRRHNIDKVHHVPNTNHESLKLDTGNRHNKDTIFVSLNEISSEGLHIHIDDVAPHTKEKSHVLKPNKDKASSRKQSKETTKASLSSITRRSDDSPPDESKISRKIHQSGLQQRKPMKSLCLGPRSVTKFQSKQKRKKINKKSPKVKLTALSKPVTKGNHTSIYIQNENEKHRILLTKNVRKKMLSSSALRNFKEDSKNKYLKELRLTTPHKNSTKYIKNHKKHRHLPLKNISDVDSAEVESVNMFIIKQIQELQQEIQELRKSNANKEKNVETDDMKAENNKNNRKKYTKTVEINDYRSKEPSIHNSKPSKSHKDTHNVTAENINIDVIGGILDSVKKSQNITLNNAKEVLVKIIESEKHPPTNILRIANSGRRARKALEFSFPPRHGPYYPAAEVW